DDSVLAARARMWMWHW
nr:Chain C, INDUCER PEPTIDE TIP2 [Escherichia coli]3ZQI_D Chain D, INDUCER PEPTIDE TIP2 [Escherichia coli]